MTLKHKAQHSCRSPQQCHHQLAKRNFTMIDTGKLLAIAVCNNKIILLPFSYLTLYLSHTCLHFRLIVQDFRTFLRFKGKFDCRLLQFFFGHFEHEKNHFSISEPPFLLFFCASLTGNKELLCGCLHEHNHACSSKKGYVLSAFFQFFVGEY